MKKEVQILDCTLRDGGYGNNWQFSPKEVQSYLNSLPAYGVQIAELGFRYPEKDERLGICAFTPDDFINRLDIPENLQIAVMIKAKHFKNKSEIDKLFDKKKNSRVDIVRIAVPYQKLDSCLEIVKCISNKGYITAVNLTKVSPKSTIKLNNLEKADILYFADTFGELYPDDVKKFINVIRKKFSGPIGFHGHNHIGMALKNTLAAIESGIDYVDSTINGSGKGAGNLKTEEISMEVNVGTKRLYFLPNCPQKV